MNLRQYTYTNCILLIFVSKWIQDYVDCYQVNHENRIREILFQRSESAAQALPVARKNHPVEVKMALDVLHVIKLDEREQTLIIKGVVRMEWEDIGLRWNKSEFGDVDRVTISSKWLWTPDLSLYTNTKDENAVITGPGLLVVMFNGIVMWEPPVTLHHGCHVNVWHFPHDVHTCDLKFGSWTYHGFALKLNTFNTSKQKYLMDEKIAKVNEWEVQIADPKLQVVYYACCPEPYMMIYYKIQLTRKSDFYHYILLYPLFAVLFIANSLFWLPPNNAEKASLAATVCLLLVIINCHLLWILPNTNTHVPAILGVTASMLFFATLSFIITLVTNNISNKKSTPPAFITRIGNSLFCRLLGTRVHTGHSADANCQSQESTTSQWPSIARGIDRICFCAYFIISFVFIGLFYA